MKTIETLPSAPHEDFSGLGPVRDALRSAVRDAGQHITPAQEDEVLTSLRDGGRGSGASADTRARLDNDAVLRLALQKLNLVLPLQAMQGILRAMGAAAPQAPLVPPQGAVPPEAPIKDM